MVRDRGWGEGQLFGDILPVARAVLHGAQDLQAALVADGLQPPDKRGRLVGIFHDQLAELGVVHAVIQRFRRKVPLHAVERHHRRHDGQTLRALRQAQVDEQSHGIVADLGLCVLHCAAAKRRGRVRHMLEEQGRRLAQDDVQLLHIVINGIEQRCADPLHILSRRALQQEADESVEAVDPGKVLRLQPEHAGQHALERAELFGLR